MRKLTFLIALMLGAVFAFAQITSEPMQMKDLKSGDGFESISIVPLKGTKGQNPPKSEEYTLTVDIVGEGVVWVNGVEYEEPMLFDEDEEITLEVTMEEGWEFEGWTGDLESEDTPVNLIMDDDKNVTATFTETTMETYTLTINYEGMGVVEVDGVEYVEALMFDEGETVNLEAIAEAGWEFDGWTGDLESYEEIESIVMDDDKTITANFVELPEIYTLTVVVEELEGHVYVNGELYTEPMDFEEGTELTLWASQLEGYVFEEWDVNGTIVTDNPGVFEITENTTVEAHFEETTETQFALTINIDGEGYTVPPAGTHYFEENEEINVEAFAGEGYGFVNWTGDVESANAAEVITMTEDIEITANFEVEVVYYTLTIDIVGEGEVHVDGVEYTEVLMIEEGTEVALEAAADEGWEFAGWTGDLESMDINQMITMDDDYAITATFEVLPVFYTLTINVVGEGEVHVDGVDYVEPIMYEENSEVELDVMEVFGWEFEGWTGDLESTEMSEMITITDDMEITATFERLGYILSISTIGSGSVLVDDVEYTTALLFDLDEEVELTAVPEAGYEFSGWTGDLSSESLMETVIMDDDKHIAAIFTEEGEQIVYWQVTFEEEPFWTFGSDAEFEVEWEVVDEDGVPSTWWSGTGWYFQPLGWYSETGSHFNEEDSTWSADGKWALIDIISTIEALGGTGPDEGSSWIQFDNIDLSSVDFPKIEFYQLFRRLNDVQTFIDLSVDGGVSWEEIRVNEATGNNEYAPIDFDLYIGDYVANQPSVSIRFRWHTNTVPTEGVGEGQVGYGWQIDDIRIVDAPPYHIAIEDTRMNFFQYYDYQVDDNPYHYSSHYGQIPAEQFTSEFAQMWFNVAVENYGVETITPILNVQVFDPNENLIYDETVSGTPLAITERDTIDLVDVEQGLTLPENPEVGEYMVRYQVFIEGYEYEDPDQNVSWANFHVTNNTMSRDGGNMTERTGPGMWMSGGNDGDGIATTFTYLYEGEVESADVFIDSTSDVGTAFIISISQWIGGSWSPLTGSTLIQVEEEHLGEWVNVEFLFPANIEFPEGADFADVRLSMEFYYNEEGNVLWIGADEDNNHSIYGVNWFFIESGNWIFISNWADFEDPYGLGLRLNTVGEDDNFVEDIENSLIGVYPNPTTGMLNIENAEGASIEIINIMGQTVSRTNNISEFETINISDLARGTYILRIINGTDVETRKINLVD